MYGLKRHPNPTFQAESSLSRSSSTSSTPSRLSSLTSNWPMPAEMYGPEGFSSSCACAAPAPARARSVAVAASGRKTVLEGNMAGPLFHARGACGADLQLWFQLAPERIRGTYAQGVCSVARGTDDSGLTEVSPTCSRHEGGDVAVRQRREQGGYGQRANQRDAAPEG